MVRITLEIRDDLDAETCLKKLAVWYERNRMNPARCPMTGVLAYYDGTVMVRRDYRKSECFVIYQSTPSPTTTGEK